MRSLATVVAVCEDAAGNPSVRCVWSPSDDVHQQGLLFMATDDLMMELLATRSPQRVLPIFCFV